MDIYAANIMDHYKSPRHYGELVDPSVHRHEANTTCGDEVDVYVKVDGEKLIEVGFKGEGCAISQAGASILFDELLGMEVEEILQLERGDVLEMLGVEITARRMKCAVLGLLAVKNALRELRGDSLLSFADLLVD